MTPHVAVDTDFTPARRVVVGRPIKTMGIFGSPGGLVSNSRCGPLGPVEHCRGAAKRGLKWLAFDANPAIASQQDWTIWKAHAAVNGLSWLWWMRTYNVGDVRFLERLTEEHGKLAILYNLETELRDGRVTFDDLEPPEGCDVGISTECGLYHSVDWSKAPGVVMPQAFQNEMPGKTPTFALANAAERGAHLVNVTVGVYRVAGQPPMTIESYEPMPTPHWSVYLIDNIEEWRSA